MPVVCQNFKSNILPSFQPFHATIEDVYDANVATDRGTVDVVRFFDTEGIEPKNSDSFSDKLPKHLFAVADGVVIVYSIDDDASFQIAEALKKEAEKYKEKKEVSFNHLFLLAKHLVVYQHFYVGGWIRTIDLGMIIGHSFHQLHCPHFPLLADILGVTVKVNSCPDRS
jgi:hypothetical protein